MRDLRNRWSLSKFKAPGVSLYFIQGTLLTVKYSSSVWGYSVHFRFFVTLYIGKDYSLSETDQNCELRGKYLVYVEYF